ncbi:hypothetical protein A5634_21360 [Mycobacterium asiaticum]|uniref:DUF805 domain-containing protein n=1 Tax=Mycobacterium asiaticum TaxID=1790 RepID=A0A1A3P3P6_MYCAS|nr:DUF805 domain-containing protein [Mycobacterium asiaticum]OBK27909.1 hypothetical protein A5634_21360 [Mycobacterium asiaticum]
MGFGQAISTGFIKYFNFSDRACRSEFWYWTLFTFIVSLGTSIIDAQLDSQIVSGLFSLATFIPSIAVSVRRLHDIDRTGWWVLIAFVPLLGIVVLLVFWVTEGTRGTNQYGPNPLAAEPFPDQQFGART